MPQAETVFYGGTILTIDAKRPQVQALAVAEGKILAAGNEDEVFALKGPATNMVDLKGKTLTPGLVEPHTHPMTSSLLYNYLDISAFTHPTAADVMNVLREAAAKAKPGEWIAGFGYDPILLRDLQALDADTLDEISTENPIWVMIQSMHTVFVNHKALEAAGIKDDVPQPSNGTFVKDKNGRLTGVIIEQGAIWPIMMAMLRDMGFDARRLMQTQIKRYVKAGYTTLGSAGEFPDVSLCTMLRDLLESEDGGVRISFMEKATDCEMGIRVQVGPDSTRFQTRGIKLWYDGSPYTGNIGLDKPYLNSELMQEGLGVPPDTCGYLMMEKETLYQLVKKYHDQGHQIIIHGQGDRAIREIVDVYERVLSESPRQDHRHRIEHGALFPLDQLQRAKNLGLTVSWHINHIHYYGEALRDDMLGEARTARLMPMASALKAGLVSSLHNDSPMYPEEPFKLMRTAVTRMTRRNEVIGPDEAIPAEEALKALTINGAWQLGLEDLVGSLEPGKLADMVILSDNPLAIEPERLHEISVLATYREGRLFTE